MLSIRLGPQSVAFKKKRSALEKKFATYSASLKKFPFTELPWRENALEAGSKKFPRCCVVGFGGSSLGTKALATALGWDSIDFLDNIDPDFVAAKLKKIDLKKTLFIIISKSGETIEVLTLFSFLLKKVPRAQFIAITDDKTSSLAKEARKNGIHIFASHSNIPGRFSVLSPITGIPTLAAGSDFAALLKGARATIWEDAFRIACFHYLNFFEDRKNVVIFPYAEKLSHFADWYIQLIAESIGKNSTTGITPIKAIGVKDQHSQLQLFLDGPDDKTYIFIKEESRETDEERTLLKAVFDAEYEGAIGAFLKRKKRFLEIRLSNISLETMGELFSLFELSVGFLGLLFNVNFQNQPAVELQKKITRMLLKKS